MDDISKRIDLNEYKKLVPKLIEASIAYYAGEPNIPDAIYDELYSQIEEFEEIYPDLILPESPTQRIYEPFTNICVREHDFYMGSLKSVTTVEEFQKWMDQHITYKGPYTCDLKMDGMALELKYQKGKLKYIVTRGDGKSGDDITRNRYMFSKLSLPYILNTRDTIMSNLNKPKSELDITVYGEAILEHHSFQTINKNNEYSNARNAVAGILRSKQFCKSYKYHISFIPYNFYSPDIQFLSQREKLEFLYFLGFESQVYPPPTKMQISNKNIDEAILYYSEAFNQRQTKKFLNFDIDGIVFKMDDTEYQRTIGYGAKSPKWAVAWKFPPKMATTILRSVVWNTGRTGRINPVGIIDPVKIDGVMVTKVNLHGINKILDMGLQLNDEVVVARLKDSVPGIYSHTYTGQSLPIEIPDRCPSCGALVHMEGKSLMCDNIIDCPAQFIKSVVHLLNEKGIKGISTSTINKILFNYHATNVEELLTISESELKELLGPKKGGEIYVNLQVLKT